MVLYPSYPGSTPMKEVVPGAGSLVEHIDKKIFVWLRDGRMYVGMLRSVDTFANLVMHNTVERIQVGKACGDIPQGILLIRGENVALLGEIGKDEHNVAQPSDIVARIASREKKKEEIDKLKVQAYLRRGKIYTPEDYF